ncbi:MAG: LytTR family DNA-binding domain-containing protein [Bacteroidota bacterium]
MIKAVFISREKAFLRPISQILHRIYPDIQLSGVANCPVEGQQLIHKDKPDLLITDRLLAEPLRTNDLTDSGVETIYIQPPAQAPALQSFDADVLVDALDEAQARIIDRRQSQEQRAASATPSDSPVGQPIKQMIGIPTMDGLEVLKVQDIIRCEGLQKCTRIVTVDRSDIVSSYNLGEFRRLLEPYDFFSPHKSYLVNLGFVKKYYKEGTLLMQDDATVPVSRRNKKKFLDRILHV